MKIAIGMSGGVDSTVAAYLLKKEGHEVVGITMSTDSKSPYIKKDIDDAKKVCVKFGIKHEVVDVEKEFKEKIIDRFVHDYINGLTPPPCNICNGLIKFKMLVDYKNTHDIDMIATGHYASIGKSEEGRYYIKRSQNEKKDQSYMLYSLTQDELKYLLFPIGDMSKDDVRDIAKDIDISISDKKDSEDLCFIKDIDYKEYIKRYFLSDDYKEKIAAGKLSEKDILDKCPFLRKGSFVDKNGKVLGYHNGIINYTIGQRKGLNIAFGDRKFVLSVDPLKNEVVLGENDDLYKDCIVINDDKDTIWQKKSKMKDNESIDCMVKVRYRDTYHKAKALYNDGKIYIKSEERIRAITKGQVAVCFDSDGILMGGIII